jgi:hypothetical protein
VEEDPEGAGVPEGAAASVSIVEKKEDSPCHPGEKDNHLIWRIGRCEGEAGK